MSFSVVWLPEAETQLAEIWLASDQRDSVSAAAYSVEKKLIRSAHDVGESREGRRRIAFEPPLVIYFHVDVPTKSVLIVDVRKSR